MNAPFVGDVRALKYARRDLVTLRRAMNMCEDRREVVQAGGNLGVFADELAQEFTSVYSFEPDPRIFRKMAQNLLYRENVFMLQAALGRDHGGVTTSRTRRRKVHEIPHDGITHVSGDGPIPRLRIDDFALQALDLLVLDTEGQELFALIGGTETIARCRPVIMIEINENCEFEGLTQEDVRTWLRAEDYSLQFREHSDEVWTWGR